MWSKNPGNHREAVFCELHDALVWIIAGMFFFMHSENVEYINNSFF